MIYHVVINGYAKDFEKQASELSGYISKYCSELKKGNTIIICGGKEDGDDKLKLAEMAPTKSVIFIVSEFYDAQVVLKILEETADDNALYLFDSSYAGQELSVRFAGRRGGSSMTGCGALLTDSEGLSGEKLVYSNHMKGTFHMEQLPYAISIQKGFPIKSRPMKTERSIKYYLNPQGINDWFSDAVLEEKAVQESLEDAVFVVAAGRGIKNKEQAKQCADIAKELGAGYGVSRPVVMNAFRGMEELIGVSGHILSPKICIAVGVSGAPAFYAGIENSTFIAAINRSEDAPIMSKADVAVIGDYQEILKELAIVMKEEGDI